MDKEQRKEYQKKYRQTNKENIREGKRIYNLNNKQKISAYNKKHGNEKIPCECGKVLNRSSLTNQRKREMHFKLLKEKKLNEEKNKTNEKNELIRIREKLDDQMKNINKQLEEFNLNKGQDINNNE